jgi:hypothetical protein
MITWADTYAKYTSTDAGEGNAGTEVARPAPEETTKPGLANRLETVCAKAVDKLDEIMELPLDPAHPAFAGVLRAQTTAANAALTVQAKVDDMTLRRQSVDRLPEILRLVAEVERKLPPPGPIDLEATE